MLTRLTQQIPSFIHFGDFSELKTLYHFTNIIELRWLEVHSDISDHQASRVEDERFHLYEKCNVRGPQIMSCLVRERFGEPS